MTPTKVLHLSGPEDDWPSEPGMKFRLTYEGLLRSTGRPPIGGQSEPEPLARHKHQIRQKFHAQLKELWRTNKFLKEHTVDPHLYPPEHPIADQTSRFVSSALRIPFVEAVAS